MGCVFAARHRYLDKPFAIKFMHASKENDNDCAKRFQQEVLALGQLSHSHIVAAVDAGEVEGIRYLVTELVKGEDLRALVKRIGPLPHREACELMRQAALALAHSHAHGYLHRDVKPSNLLLHPTGQVKLLDFGLVRQAGVDSDLTAAGSMMGTCDFVAPEQAHDASSVDERSDIYGLGCTLLFLLTGLPPFAGARYASAPAKLKGHLFDRPEQLQSPPREWPTGLISLLEQMMAKSPSQRFSTASKVAEALSPLCVGAELSGLSAVNAPSNRSGGRTPSISTTLSRPVHLRTFRHPYAVVALCVLGGLAVFAFAQAAIPKIAKQQKTTPSHVGLTETSGLTTSGTNKPDPQEQSAPPSTDAGATPTSSDAANQPAATEETPSDQEEEASTEANTVKPSGSSRLRTLSPRPSAAAAPLHLDMPKQLGDGQGN